MEKLEIKKLTLEEKAIKDIIEITFKYKDINNFKINTTLFFDFLGIKDEEYKNKNYRQLKKFLKKNNIEEKIKNKLEEEIKKIEKKINSLDKNNELYNFLLKAYNYNKNILQITILGLPFEFEKAGIINNLSLENKKEILKKQDKLETENGMGKISDNQDYSKISYNFLKNKIEENKHNLTQKDLEKFNEFLNIIEKGCGKNFKYKPNVKNKETKTKKFVNEKLSKIKIPREDVIKLFELALKVNGINKKIIEDNIDFIYDGPDALYYPKNKNFDFLKAHRVFALIDHEIEKHFLNDKIHKIIFGKNIERGHGNLEKEEGLAIGGEKILLGEKIEDISIISTFVQTYIGEIVSGEKLKEFLNLLSKIVPIKNIDARFYRLKRNKDLELPGVQRKDSLYTLGLLKTLNYIQSGNDLRKLFLGKISFNDIDNIYKLKKEKINFGEILPIGVSEILMFKFLQRHFGKNDFPNFDSYIINKYSNKNKDFLREITKEQKKVIAQMDFILKKYIK